MTAKKESRSSLDKILPHNTDAEEAVLGSIFINNEGLYKIIDVVSPEDFYSIANKEIYDAILTLFNEKSPIDLVTVTEILERRGQLDSIGGVTYLSRIVNSVPTASHIVQYASIVREKKILRDLIVTASEISALGYNEDEKIDIVLDNAEQLLFGISQKSLRKNFISLQSMLSETFERIDDIHKNKGQLRGVPTGFDDLDDILGGLQKSDLVILAARPSMGKTSLALNMALNSSIKNKASVGIFSLEMSKDQLVDRLISSTARVDAWKLRTGNLAEEDFPRIGEAMSQLNEAKIYIDDTPGLTVMEMRAKARRLKAEQGLDMIIVDYLQLMGGGSENRVQEISEISRSLKGLARELNVPVIALSQLNRALEARPDKRPILSDLRESGSIEQDADVVMFVFREDYYDRDTNRKNIADILIRKHRNGPTGEVSLYFVSDQMRFANLDKKHT
ncbi:MAG TPA: replicative DNA helicase [Patescibacteria group bacterium]|nr:replicative DNA helicase [Patescibacteria group bacterium]